jgi:hypothetical protein
MTSAQMAENWAALDRWSIIRRIPLRFKAIGQRNGAIILVADNGSAKFFQNLFGTANIVQISGHQSEINDSLAFIGN